MDIVVMNLHINRDVELDGSYLVAVPFTLLCDVIDFIAVHLRENTAHMSDDTILSAVVNAVISYDVGADTLLAKANVSRKEYGFHLIGVAGLSSGFRTEVVACGDLFAKGDG